MSNKGKDKAVQTATTGSKNEASTNAKPNNKVSNEKPVTAGSNAMTSNDGKKNDYKKRDDYPARPQSAKVLELTEKLNSLKKIVKPDPKERDDALNANEDKRNALKKELEKIQAKIDGAKDVGADVENQRQQLRAALNKAKDEQKDLKSKRDVLMVQQKSVLDRLTLMKTEEKKMKEQTKFGSIEKVEEEYQRLSHMQETENFSLKEEKDLIKKMEQLRASKKIVEKYHLFKVDLEKEQQKKKDVSDRIKELNVISDAARASYDAAKNKLTALEAKISEKNGDIPSLRTRRDEIRKEMDALWKEKQKLHADWNVKNQSYFDGTKEQRELRDAIRKVEEEERRAEEEAKRALAEAEEAKRKPWEKEISYCDQLISYLEQLSLTSGSQTVNNPTQKKTSAPAAPKAPTIPGLKMLPRKQDRDSAYMIMSKPAAAAAPAAVAPAAAEKKSSVPVIITLNPDLLKVFKQIGAVPPRTSEDISASLEQVRERRAHFDVLPRSTPSNGSHAGNGTTAEEGGDAAAAGDSKKKSKKEAPVVESSELFPLLPGQKSPKLKAAPISGGQSAVDKVKSSGAVTTLPASALLNNPTPSESQAVTSE